MHYSSPRTRVRRRALSSLAGLSILLLLNCSDDSPTSPEPEPQPVSRTAVIEISDPPRGAMIAGGTMDTSAVDVSGAVCDSSATVSGLTIGGSSVALTGTPPCLAFDTQVESRWGFNIIRGQATNDTGYRASIVQSYLRSPDYFASALTANTATGDLPIRGGTAGGGSVDKVPGGLYMRLNQEFVDDGAHGSASNPSEIDDLASVIQLTIRSINLNDAIPNPISISGDANNNGQIDTKTCDCLWPIPDITIHVLGYRVGKGTLTHTPANVDWLDLVDGGLDMGYSMYNVRLPVSVSGYLGQPCATACVDRVDVGATVTGTVKADHIYVDPRVDVSLENGSAVVTVDSINVTFGGLFLDIDWGLLEFLDDPIGLSSITSDILTSFQDDIETEIEKELTAQIPPLVEDALQNFSLPETVTLPAPVGTTINIASEFDVLDFRQGVAYIGFAVGASPANPKLTSPLGPIQRGGGLPTFADGDYAAGAAFKDDLVNQFLWAAWRGGALDISDLSALGCDVPDGFSATMTVSLPPVVMPGTNGYQIDIGVGDVYVEASLPAAAATAAASAGAALTAEVPEGHRLAGVAVANDVAMYVSTVVGATLAIDAQANELVLTMQDDPEVAVQLIRAPADADLTALANEYSATFECALDVVLSNLFSSFPLLSVPVNGPGVPPGHRWELGNGVMERQDPYYTVTGDVVVK